MNKPRNPMAKAVRQIRPQVIPDKRRKLVEKVEDNALDCLCCTEHEDLLYDDDGG